MIDNLPSFSLLPSPPLRSPDDQLRPHIVFSLRLHSEFTVHLTDKFQLTQPTTRMRSRKSSAVASFEFANLRAPKNSIRLTDRDFPKA